MKPMSLISCLFALFLVLTFTGCDGGGTSSAENDTMDLTGVWQGYEMDADNDGQTDEFPEEMFFIEIKDENGNLSGQFIALVNGEYYFSAVTGQRLEDSITLILAEDDYQVSFHGLYSNADGWPAWFMEWTDSDDDFGQVVFSRVDDIETLNEENLLSTISSYWGNTYSLTHKFGQGPPVVFIHGANSNESIWNSFVSRLEAAGLGNSRSVYTYNYKWEDPVVDISRDLKTRIDGLGLQSPVLIGGHTGGLVARQYIGTGGSFDRLITLGTPQMGTYLQSLYIPIIGWLMPSGLTDLAYHSNFMNGLQENRLDIAARPNYKAITGRLSGYKKRRCNAVFNNCWDEWVWTKHYNLYLILAHGIIKASTKGALGEKGSESDGLTTCFSANFGNCNDSACADAKVAVSTICDHWGLFLPAGCPTAYNWVKEKLFQ